MISVIAAVAKNRVIGRDGDLPWRIPSDLKRFKAITLGHTLIMGRATYDSIGRPLPGRKTVVLTRNREWSAEGVEVVHDMDSALDRPGELFIAGGAQIYELAIPRAQVMHLSMVDFEPEGDTLFPQFSAQEWMVTERVETPAGPGYEPGYTYLHMVRIAEPV